MSREYHTIGHSKQNLVLKTAGSIRVWVGDKYYDLNFREDESKLSDNEENNNINQSFEDNILIINTINGYEYPGDNKVIMTLDGDMYYTSKGSYNKYLSNVSIPSDFSNTINS